jgi:D-beta-D-heptose 7-phosphate kinase/D-beta-D-heptose 1-phosphate adenosyltransferase
MNQILRVDTEDTRPIPEDASGEVALFVRQVVRDQNAVVVSDYAKGLFSAPLLKDIIATCRKARVPVIVDPKPKPALDLRAYRGATVIKPNRYETQIITGLPLETEGDMRAAASKLQGDLDASAVVLSLDRDGMYLYEAEKGGRGPVVKQSRLIRAQPREVSDVTGAGDMVTGMLALAIGAGAGFQAAAELSNVAADIAVGKFGVAQVSRDEIAAELRRRERGVPDKLKSLPELLGRLGDHRRKKETVVFTNGCFDLLHIGHIEYLKFARRQGGLLVVGLNSDRSVRNLKGPGRPILKQEERARVLAALEDVDYIVIFEETTPEKLIEQVRPDVLVKGEDWREKGVVGQEFVESYGGRVVLAPLVEGISTSDIVSRILEQYGNAAEPPRRAR